MLFRITASGDESLDDVSRTSNLADYYIVPVARSESGSGDWERVAGPYAQDLTVSACGSTACQVSIPVLPNLDEGKFILMSFANSKTDREEVSRFFHQTTFGPTMDMIDSFNYSGDLNANMASWVHDQMYSVPMTSHREYFRQRLDGSLRGWIEEPDEEHEEIQMLKVKNPCDVGSRWIDFSFTNDDYGESFEVTQRNEGDYLITVDNVPRTVVSEWVDDNGDQLRVGDNWEFCKYAYLLMSFLIILRSSYIYL